jgi:Ca2+-binding RTX toxin-like protein
MLRSTILVAALLVSSSASANTINGTAGNDTICLYNAAAGTPRACVNGVSQFVSLPVTLNGWDGNDTIMVAGPGGCHCTCVGPSLDFVYSGSTVTINGGSGNDLIIGGNGSNVMTGGAGDDQIRGGTGTDTIRGEAGKDRIADPGGTMETLDAGDDADCLHDSNCTYSSCTCGAGTDQSTCWGVCSACEGPSPDNCTVFCP